MRHPDYPVDRPEGLRAVALDVLARWPDHPVADHARLALVRADMPRGSGDAWDPDEIASLLASMSEAHIREWAALEVTRGGSGFRRVDGELLDAMARVPTHSAKTELMVSTWAMNRAVFLKDWARARAWADRVRATLDAECQVDEPHHSLNCESRAYELRDVSARLVAVGAAEPRSWQEALTAEAWRCHLEVERHRGTSRTHATWTGTVWAFEPWDRDTAVTDCLDDVRTTAVVPEEPTRVRLTVEGGG